MNWNKILSVEDVHEIIANSNLRPQVIYKHSTRCGISALALARLNSSLPHVDYHVLDLIAYREISNLIATTFHITHQSPQVLIIIEGKCIFHTSHMNITTQVIKKEISEYV